jgi:type IV secretory pathway TraG/TraD family ATPase VirD4
VLGGLFGKSKKQKEEEAKRQAAAEAFYNALPPAKQELYGLLMEARPHTEFGYKNAWKALTESDDAGLKRALLKDIIPQVPPDLQERLQHVGKRSNWATLRQIAEGGVSPPTLSNDTISVGHFSEGDVDCYIQFTGEGHLLTVAPTGAGKGQGHIIPALLEYNGPVVVLDPKGENYRETAWYRRWCGEVFKWAPYDPEDTDCFNPLDFVEGYRDAKLIADLIVGSGFGKDEFWVNSAKELIVGLILYLKTSFPPEKQNLRQICRMLAQSRDEFEEMVDALRESDQENLIEIANILDSIPEKTLGNIYAQLRSHTTDWRDEEIARATASTSPGMQPSEILARQHLGDVWINTGNGPESGPQLEVETANEGKQYFRYGRGHGDTVYLIVPPEKLASNASIFRVIIGVFINEMTKAMARMDREWEKGRSREDLTNDRWTPALFLLDELPQLGYMPVIENAIAIARGSRLRLWLFVQDLAQLTQAYPKADSLLANTRMKFFFKPNDLKTAQHISDYLGDVTDLFGQSTPLATPQELMGPDYKDDQIILASGVPPIRSRLRLKYEDPVMLESEDLHRDFWEGQADRKEVEGRVRTDEPLTPSPLPPEPAPLSSSDDEPGEPPESDPESVSNPSGTPTPPSFDK